MSQTNAATRAGSQPGTYVLILALSESCDVHIGRLGTRTLPAGWYSYVGSSFGSGGLAGRLKHHLAPVQHPHWHIDYLRRAAPLEAVWYTANPASLEHAWASALGAMPGASMPVPRFGASDCRCATHLFHFGAYPSLKVFQKAAGCDVHHWPVITVS